MKTAAVILNYNDSDQTIEAVQRIAGFELINTIIVVDNASTDGSAEKLKSWLKEENRRLAEAGDENDEDETEQFHRYMLVRADKNGGYGYGNNLGVQYAYEIAGAELVLIANPDAVFTEDCVREMILCFENEPQAAVVSVPSAGKDGKPQWQLSAWPLRSFTGELVNSGPLLRRVFRNTLNYPAAVFKGGQPVTVDAVHGAFLMVDADRFMACGGYDEEMFLYGEENVLAWKMRENGSKTFLITDCTYLHRGGGTTTRSLDALKRQKLRQSSELFYYKKYLEASGIQLLAARLFQKFVLLETGLFIRK
ncbi:MAG: glycosyltransferase family 2 protein [Eubacteriales bacterium]|nr:glycosyltransferase family 2 protein [Eubacteriales bacterium]